MPQPDLFNPPDDDLASAKIQLVMALRTAGIRDNRLLSAVELVPREVFVPRMFADRAYENTALPISAGQTINAPELVARMLEALDVQERSIVLEIGTGSGYQAAILAQLARRVFTMEYYPELREEARQRLEQLQYSTIATLGGDGHKGWPDAAPYDRIIVTAALQAIPSALLEQLSDDGRLIAPVGQPGHPQKVLRVDRDKWNFSTTTLFEAPFDPMIEAAA